MPDQPNTNPLPPDAHCVYKGGSTEIWQWKQKLYDGSTKIYEKIKRPDTVEVIAAVGDTIIIEEQEQPGYDRSFLSVPGGQADGDGEDHLSSMKRELLEETGYASDDWEPWFTVTPSKRHIYSVHYFIARNCRYTQAPDPGPGERIRVQLVSFDEFLLMSERPDFRSVELINKLLRMRLHADEREAFRQLIFKK
jgi:8-oxo-dGTP pyrophosphatase MutT (NUDIX family)